MISMSFLVTWICWIYKMVGVWSAGCRPSPICHRSITDGNAHGQSSGNIWSTIFTWWYSHWPYIGTPVCFNRSDIKLNTLGEYTWWMHRVNRPTPGWSQTNKWVHLPPVANILNIPWMIYILYLHSLCHLCAFYDRKCLLYTCDQGIILYTVYTTHN